MRRIAGPLLALGLLAALPAGAQQSVLPGLFGQAEPGGDPGPAPAAAAAPEAPTHVEETGKAPDGPPSVGAAAYDSRVRASFASAEAFQGPLDGGWTLAARTGGDLYAFQLSDRGHGVEGAWRDLGRPGRPGASGLIEGVDHEGARLSLRFGDAAVSLQSGAGEVWTGELVQGGRSRPVILRRTGP